LKKYEDEYYVPAMIFVLKRFCLNYMYVKLYNQSIDHLRITKIMCVFVNNVVFSELFMDKLKSTNNIEYLDSYLRIKNRNNYDYMIC